MYAVAAPDRESEAEVDEARVSLRQSAASGRTARLRSLIDAHSGPAARALRARGVQIGELDDALQMVFLVVARRLGDIEVGRERGFILATAFRVASRVHRGVRRRHESGEEPSADVPSSVVSPDQALEQREALDQIQCVLQDMTPDLAQVFMLFEVEEQSTLEIARALGIPKGTVQSRLRRAREQFRDKLARLQGEERPSS